MPFLGKTPSQIVDPEVDIDGGTIDGVSIGSVTANAGAFTNLTATGTLTLPDDGISGDDVNGGTISNFASTGIDDNATSTAITIDASQRVGIGATSLSHGLQVGNSASGQNLGLYSSSYASNGLARFYGTDSVERLQIGSLSATAAYLYTPASTDLTFFTGGSQNMTLDASGNLGLSATPDAHYTGYSVFNVGASAVVLGNETTSDTNVTMTINNAYLNTGASAWVYKNSGEATRYTQISGQHRWDTAASGTAGATISWSEAMRINSSGNVGIGTTSPFSTARLQVNTGTNRNLAVQTGTTETSGMKINAFNDAGTLNIPLELNGSVTLLKTGETERMRIDSSGDIRLTATGASAGDNLTTINFYNTSSSLNLAAITGFRDSGGTNYGGLKFSTTNAGSISERMRIDTSGNVSIGTSSTASALFKTDIKGSSTGNFQALRLFNSSDGASATTDLSFCLNRVGSEVLGVAGSIKAGKEQTWTTTPSTVDGYLSFSTVLNETPAERMRIDSLGNLVIGKNNTLVSGNGLILKPLGDTYCSITNGYNTLHVYDITNSVYRFYVGGNGQVNYYSLNNLSDERDKQNIVDIPHGLSTVMSLKPRKFDWREEDQANGVYGFIAQEVETLLPSLVGEYKKDDNTNRKSLKQMELIPVLTKAIQEQQAIIEDLQTRLSALEAN